MKVSVVIPAYNHEKFIGEAVESVLNQSLQDFELIIVNDGSTDGTEKEIKKFNDRRIRYFYQNNQGAHRTLNLGIRLAMGEYVAILNSDDVYHPERLERCAAYLEDNREFSVVITRVEGIDDTGLPVVKKKTPHVKAWLKWYEDALPYFNNDAFYPNAFSKNILITTSNYFAKKDTFLKIGEFAELRYTHDWDMLLRLSMSCKIHLLEDVLLKYRMHEANTVHEEDSEEKVKFEVNWLIVENIKRLVEQEKKIPDFIRLLKQNHYVSFETLFKISVLSYAHTCRKDIYITYQISKQLIESIR